MLALGFIIILREGLVHKNTSIKAPRHSDAVGFVRGRFVSRRICHAPRRVGGYRSCFWQSCLNSAASVETCAEGLPPSLRERLRENLLSARAFIAKRLAKAVLGTTFIAPSKAIFAPLPMSLSLSAHAGS